MLRRATTAIALASLWACGGGEEMSETPPPANNTPMPMDMMMETPMCPPVGPFGTRNGQAVPNVILDDCEGNTYSLHDLCGKKASWFFVHAAW